VVKAKDVQVHAHRAILCARCPALAERIGTAASNGPVVSLDGPPFDERPELVRTLVEQCYAAGPPTEAIDGFAIDLDLHSLVADLATLEPVLENKMCAYASPDLRVIGSHGGAKDGEVQWSVLAHASIVLAQSEYARSLILHGWSEHVKAGQPIELHLDSAHFTEDTIRELVSACYGTGLEVCDEPIESLLSLFDAARFLVMEAPALLCEEAIAARISPETFSALSNFAADNGAALLAIKCHKYLCRKMGDLSAHVAQFRTDELEAALNSEFLALPEEETLAIVLEHAERAQLIRLVRLPLVPLDSASMKRAVAEKLVSDEELRVCRLFQEQGSFRQAMMQSGEARYRLRQGEANVQAVHAQQQSLAEEQRREMRRVSELVSHRVCCRMLGTVNGRADFQKICAFEHGTCGGGFHWTASEDPPVRPSDLASLSIPFSFESVAPRLPAISADRRFLIDAATLEAMPSEEVRALVEALLRREDELRLHPKVQAAYTLIGESEEELSRFTTALQAHVASEMGVDAPLGIDLIRSASVLFPDVAQIAHYVRHNRCFAGTLRVGDNAPDVELATIDGARSTLWDSIDAAARGQPERPVLIVGASYT
jgi:hypothetical protein